jgi:hypothetical protein
MILLISVEFKWELMFIASYKWKQLSIIIIIIIIIIMIIKDAYRGLNEGRLDDWCLHLEIYHKTILMFRE